MKLRIKILIVVGTRPNFIKITQFPGLLRHRSGKFDFRIVHTRQHYDDKMSKIFFEQLKLSPDIFLKTKNGSQVVQMSSIMTGLEKVILNYKPDLVIVVGDVNSTAAAALVASKLNVRIAHIESGLRSFDRTMPEEFNRIITDAIADVYFVTEQSGLDNLLHEGKKEESIFFVGNTMIDTMVSFAEEIDQSDILEKLKLDKGEFILTTIHRPFTVDSKDGLIKLIELLNVVGNISKIVFPIHPRTIMKLQEFDLYEKILQNNNLILTEPLDYFAFQKLIKYSRLILTDSGGVQEESTFLQVPCLTLRPNTERPVTVTLGTNQLVTFDNDIVVNKLHEIMAGNSKKGKIPPLWDGKATERVLQCLDKLI